MKSNFKPSSSISGNRDGYPKGFNRLSPEQKYMTLLDRRDEYTWSKIDEISDYYCSEEQIEEYYEKYGPQPSEEITPLDLGENGGFDLFR